MDVGYIFFTRIQPSPVSGSSAASFNLGVLGGEDEPTSFYSIILKPFSITVTQVYAPTSNAEAAEVEQFYEDLQDLLELTPKKDVFFTTGDWNEKVRSQEIPGVAHNFGLEVQNEAGERLTEFCQENALVIANTLFQQHKRRLYRGTSPDGQC